MRWTLRDVTLLLVLVCVFMPTVACEPPEAGREQGVISGVVTDWRGDSLKNASIFAREVSSGASYEAKTGSAGSYEMRNLPDGSYRVTGFVYPDHQGGAWKLPLDPAHNSVNPVSTTNGVRKDFQWLLAGQKPSVRASHPYAYYGAYISVDTDYLSPNWPEDAVVDFTLVPTGPLIDGSKGKTLSYSRTVAALRTEHPAPLEQSHFLHDVPIGPYRLTAQLATPDDTVCSMDLRTGFGSEPFQEIVDVDFQPSTTFPDDGAEPLTLWIKDPLVC